MKKHSLFKILAIFILLSMVATYVVPMILEEANVSYLGFGDVLVNFVQSFYYFFDTMVFVLVVGGFYCVLSKIPAYKTLVDKIVLSFKEKEKVFVIVTTIMFALIASLTGIELPLFVVVPFVVAIILAMGYDKLVAISSTIGGILVGNMAGIFSTVRSSGNYSVTFVTFEELVGLDSMYTNIIPKAILLVLSIGLLVFYILRHIRKASSKELKYDLGGKLELVGKTSNKDTSVSLWPMIILGGILVKYLTIIIDVIFDIPEFSWKIFNYSSICSIVVLVAVIVLVVKFGRARKSSGNVLFAISMVVMLLFLMLGFTPWNDLFGTTLFTDIHNAVIKEFTIKDYSIFESILSDSIKGFGTWGTWGNFMMPILMLLGMTLVLKFTYNIKFDELFESLLEGFKKALSIVVLIAVAYSILISVVNNGFLTTIIAAFDNNIILQLLMTIIGTVLTVDSYYAVAIVFSSILSVVKDYLEVMALAFQSLRGLVQFIAPTSLLLIIGLTYFGVPYRTWFKYVWRLVLGLFILVGATLLILALI